MSIRTPLRIYYWLAPHSPFKMLPKMMIVILMAFTAVVTFYTISFFAIKHIYQPPDEPKLTYSQFKDKVRDKELAEYIILQTETKLFQPSVLALFTDLTDLTDGPDGTKKWTYFDQAPARIPQMSPQEWLDENGYNVEQTYSFPTTWILFQTFQGFTMSIPFFFFLWVIAGGGLRSTMQEWGTIKQATMQRRLPIYFREIGGLENAIKECRVFVRMLKNPLRGRNLKANMPKGVLISGPPGTGKTMLGTAIATEAGVPHFFITGAQFGQPLVGMGRETVNHFFDLLFRNAPCVGIIDEFDSAAPARGSDRGMGSTERDAITNTVLSKLDEIQKKNLPILIVGITNLLDTVDAAAKREGRFDRFIVVSAPGKAGRAKIIQIHLTTPELTPLGIPVVNNGNSEKPVEEFSATPPDFVGKLAEELAEITAGFSGAALGTLVNEARITADEKIDEGLRKQDFVTRQDFYDALPRAITRSQKRDLILNEAELERIAWHEGAHTYFSRLYKHAERTSFMFLEPHGPTLGQTVLDRSDSNLYSKSQILALIRIYLAGYVIEEAQFGEVTIGPGSDIIALTKIARHMTHDVGMGDQGPIAIDVLEGQTGNNTSARIQGPISHKAQEEAQAIINDARDEMVKLLEDRGDDSHFAKIGNLAEAVREKHMLGAPEIDEIIGDIEQIECGAVS